MLMRNSSRGDKWSVRYMNPDLTGLGLRQQETQNTVTVNKAMTLQTVSPGKDLENSAGFLAFRVNESVIHEKMFIFCQVSVESGFSYRDLIQAWACDFALG